MGGEGGSRGLIRYPATHWVSFVERYPVKYIDPSGHMRDDGCRSAGCSSTEAERIASYKNAMAFEYGWITEVDFSEKELASISNAGNKILKGVDYITRGKGYGWMRHYLGGTDFVNGGFFGKSVTISGVVHLTEGWENSDLPDQHVTHELGHIWDDNITKGNSCASTWCGGGAGDALTTFVGGDPQGIRWSNGSSNIPGSFQWVDPTYGNHSTADYLAESFRAVMYVPKQLPQPSILYWMQALISIESSTIP